MPITLTKYGLPQILLASAIALAVSLPMAIFLSGWWLVLLAVPIGLWAFVLFFFRSPRRVPPEGEGLLVSPADGFITHIEACDEEEFIGEATRRVSIFLTVFDVHLNRAPVAGRVEKIEYTKGEYLNAMKAQSARRNERNDICMRAENGEPFIVRQISGAIARRIVCDCEVGDEFERGEILGMIKFGSRTDVFFPARLGFEPAVKIGRHVNAGRTILGRFV